MANNKNAFIRGRPNTRQLQMRPADGDTSAQEEDPKVVAEAQHLKGLRRDRRGPRGRFGEGKCSILIPKDSIASPT